MVTEDYVSFEVAKLLKEKGFDEPCRAVYEEKVLRTNTLCDYHNSELSSYVCAPTLQMAMKWLRGVHNIDVCTCRELDEDGKCFDGYISVVYKDKIYRITIRDAVSDLGYEEACEAAIKYCLENLI